MRFYMTSELILAQKLWKKETTSMTVNVCGVTLPLNGFCYWQIKRITRRAGFAGMIAHPALFGFCSRQYNLVGLLNNVRTRFRIYLRLRNSCIPSKRYYFGLNTDAMNKSVHFVWKAVAYSLLGRPDKVERFLSLQWTVLIMPHLPNACCCFSYKLFNPFYERTWCFFK